MGARLPDWVEEGIEVVHEGEVWTIKDLWVTGDYNSDWYMVDLVRSVGMLVDEKTVAIGLIDKLEENKKKRKSK